MDDKTPLMSSAVQAGFPSPADDFLEESLNLHRYVVRNPASTFFVRAEGESMTESGIFPGSILVVDRSLTPKNGSVVIAIIQGEFTVKRLKIEKGAYFLLSEGSRLLKIKLESEDQVFGVVTFTLKALC